MLFIRVRFKTSALETQKEKESYSIGYQVGISMKNDGVEVNFERLAQGLRDAINGKEPSLGQEEMKKLIVDLKKMTREAKMLEIQEQVVQNAADAEKFLVENKEKDGVRTTESGLQYIVLKEGDGITPKLEDTAVVHYVGTFTDGKEFDNSHSRNEPAKVRVNGVIKGWTEALPMMKTGSHWKLFVPPDLAYGRNGMPPRIPPNKVLVFEMKLLAVEKAKKPDQASDARSGLERPVRNLTGEIAKSEHGYIIRSRRDKTLSEIYTILNPDPKILDPFVTSARTVPIDVRSISGDNVNIVKINGEEYR
jgi:FKBP-type peptidyl-prolyl cis-trans isomerase